MYIPSDEEINAAEMENDTPGVDEFTITPIKLAEVTVLIRAWHGRQISVADIENAILADWNEGQEHQDWLDNASANEIADWVIGSNYLTQ